MSPQLESPPRMEKEEDQHRQTPDNDKGETAAADQHDAIDKPLMES